ncbi:phage regulatory CII family protein [Pseudomonas sp. TUM22785]|uniref:phage regulatory CII family protein n=1 Tax=Pseudomonas sp. TUM22785 TaxID=3019098 RepID=UPI002306CEED|nr:phage regulatory CII family protein [Pseudomonas sp. TUM22785]WCD79169.1 Rha family transcriptional regulator [Pseudomonas sp. TUM22785]
MDHFLRAIHDTVHDGEPKKLAAAIAMPHVSLLQRVNPDNDAHWPNVKHFYALLLHSGDLRSLAALADDFGHMIVPKEEAEPKAIPAAVLGMHTEIADVTRAVADALADNRVTELEKKMIRREIQEARKALDTLEASVKVA